MRPDDDASAQARIEPASPSAIEEAALVIAGGGVVALPTDTVYGVAASLAHQRALQRIYEIKGRPDDKPLPVLLASAADLRIVAAEPTPVVLALADRFWPGPLTIVVPARPDLPPESTGREADGRATVGVRTPAHPVAIEVIARAGGALAVTSANRSGQPAATSAAEVAQALGAECDLILDGGASPGGVPSTVVAIDGDRLHVLREGAIAADRLESVWRRLRHSMAAGGDA